MVIGINNLDPSSGLLQGADTVNRLRQARMQPTLDNIGLASNLTNLQQQQFNLQRGQETAPLEDRMRALQEKQAQQGLRIGEQRLAAGGEQLEAAKAKRRQDATIALGRFAKSAKGFEGDERAEYIQSVIPSLNEMGLDTSGLDPASATDADLDRLIALGESVQKPTVGAGFQKGRTVLVQTDQGPAFATSVFDETSGTTKTSIAPIGTDLISAMGETREEQMESRTTEAGQKAEAAGLSKASASSIGSKITDGLAAADGTAILRRSISLLDEIKTGGFQSAKLKAKQFAGVEGADEGELSFNLGKNVLSQLRQTFGAAFTAKEGEQLKTIEAGLGKSTAANKRLLQQALKISERAARRGIAAAEKGGEQFDFERQEIEEALNFDISPVNQGNTGSTTQRIRLDAQGNIIQ